MTQEPSAKQLDGEILSKDFIEEINFFISLCSESERIFSLSQERIERKAYVLLLNSRLLGIYAQLESLFGRLTREYLKESLTEFFKVIRESGFVKRCQDRPLGYMGDYITIEEILTNTKSSKPNTLGYEIDRSILDSPISQQHRNKIGNETHLIRQALRDNLSPKVLCFSVGGCTHISKMLAFLIVNKKNKKDYSLHLHDTSDEAITLSKKRLEPVIDHCTFYDANIIKLVRKDLINERFDLITLGGIIDYIGDKGLIMILKSLYPMLKEGGKIYITQLSKNNLYECFMYYIVFWDVIYRSEGDLRTIFNECDIPNEKIKITKDLTEITYLVELSK